MTVVFSRRDAEWFSPPNVTDRRYLIAPLTYRERQAFRADLTREGGIYPTQAQMLDTLRVALREAAPENLAELLANIEQAEAAPDDPDAQTRLASIEAACATMLAYAHLLAARQRYMGALPYVSARHALRGWEGDGLPAFQRQRGMVPDELLEVLPQAELEAIGWHASLLMQPGREALGNSEAPSQSHETPAPMTAA